MKRKLSERKKVNYVKIPELNFAPRRKKKGRSSAGNKLRRVQMVKSNHKRLIQKGDALTDMTDERKEKKKLKKGQNEAAAEAENVEKKKMKARTNEKNKNVTYALKRFTGKE